MSKATICGIHLDLKYLMSSKAYLNNWVRELPELGINTLLIEYEDKFPYEKHACLRHPDAFTPDELRQFLKIAREVRLRIIPLVQTLSHLEFALGHEQFAHLREAPHIITQIDPTNPDAIAFVRHLVEEVLAYHEQDDWFHLGADEAWHLGNNERTKKLVDEKGVIGVWAEHENQLISWIINEKGKRPLVWDDIFWQTPERINDVGLPKETILMAWSYGITDLGVDWDSKGQGNELGGASGKLKQVDVYRKAGYDVIATPCLNWGTLVPQHDHCLKNTSAWAQKVKLSGMMGMINSAWACFHVLPHAQNLHIAATAESLNDSARPRQRAWQDEFLTERYGVNADGAADALEKLGTAYDWRTEGMERGITPIVYAYTDMYHWYGSQKRRKAEGLYAHDWDAVDFVQLFQFKMDALRAGNAAEVGVPADRIRTLKRGFDDAVHVLDQVASQATRHQAEARYLAVSARLLSLHAEVVLHLIAGEGDRTMLHRRWQAVESPLRDALEPLFAPVSLQQAMRIWWEPTAATLRQ